MTRKQRRFGLIAIIGIVWMVAALLVLLALQEDIDLFYSPTDIVAENKVGPGQRFRLGGLVKNGSLEKAGENVAFIITDTEHDVNVHYQGILPDLFREGQGVIAEGQLGADGGFAADTILAKHDETYMPKEVADTLKQKGVWQGQTSERENTAQ